jgi:hypothetical protein
MSVPSNAGGPLLWPRWTYVPGEAGNADADHETLAIVKALVPAAFRGYVPARHPALRYGLTLNDRGYFWEAQEVLETVWAAAPQGSRERILLRACVHVANANLRLRMQRLPSAARLFGDALAEVRSLNTRKVQAAGDGFVETFPVAALAALLQARLGREQLSKADWIALGATARSS